MALQLNSLSAWLDRSGQLFEQCGQAPAPSKDFCQIIVTPDQVIFRWWKISHRTAEVQRLSPGEIRESYEDFLYDDRTQMMISATFSQNMIDYLKNLCHGHIDYLPRLPKPTLLKILSYLELEDVARLSLLNKFFHKLAQDDDLWRMYFGSATSITPELEALAKDQGWKKLFFSNKLEIQMQLRRRRDVQISDQTFITASLKQLKVN